MCKTLQSDYTQRIRVFLQEVISTAAAILAPAPGEFCILGLGSLSRGELSLASDVEIAIVVKDPTLRSAPYFQYLLKIMQEKLACAGEHAAFGLHLDSSFTVQLTTENPPLLDTPEGLAARYAPARVHPRDAPYAYALYRPVCLYPQPEHPLFKQYCQAMRAVLGLEDGAESAKKAAHLTLAKAYLDFHDNLSKDKASFKQRYLAPLVYGCLDLAAYYGFTDTQGILLNAVPEILHQLSARNVLAPIFAQEMLDAWALLQQLRIRIEQQWVVDRWRLPPDPTQEMDHICSAYLSAADIQQLNQVDQTLLQPFYRTILAWLDSPRLAPFDPAAYAVCYLGEQLHASAQKTEQKTAEDTSIVPPAAVPFIA